MSETVELLKEGDAIYCNVYQAWTLHTVVRVTPTQAILENGTKLSRSMGERGKSIGYFSLSLKDASYWRKTPYAEGQYGNSALAACVKNYRIPVPLDTYGRSKLPHDKAKEIHEKIVELYLRTDQEVAKIMASFTENSGK